MKKELLLVAVLVAGIIPMHAQGEVLLKIGCQDEPKTLNIWKATDVWTTHAVNWFYPGLYYRKPVTLEPLPDICTLPYADLLANSPDGLTYTFPLRGDVTWDDGTPLTAYDFEFTYTVIMELEIPDYIPAFEDVEYVRAVDDYTLEVKLTKCSPQFEESVIYHFGTPKQQFEPMLIEARRTDVPLQTFLDMDIDDPVSAGPFSFGQWEKGSYVKLVTNPDYYGKGRTVDVEGVGTITEGPDYDGLLLKLYGTTDAALLGIQKGEIDFIWWNLDPGYIAQVLGNPDVTIEKADELGFYYLAPNCAKEPFDDMKLRQALVYLVQKDFIVDRVLQGYGGEAHSVVMPAAGEWYNDNINKFGHGMSKDERVAKAVEVLTGAAYTVPVYTDGTPIEYPEAVVLLPDGTPMQPFEILTPPADYDPMRAMAGVLVQEWWREIGIPVTAKSTSFGEIVHKTFESMTFDWYILGWRIGGAGYPDHMRYFFHSDQAVPDGNNPMGYKNQAVDRALEDLMTLCDHDELVTAAHKAQELIVEEVGYCPLYYRTLNEAHRNDTFTGWFTQLGGIAGTESPRHCLPYLKPIDGGPGATPAATKAPKGPPAPPQKPGLPVKPIAAGVALAAAAVILCSMCKTGALAMGKSLLRPPKQPPRSTASKTSAKLDRGPTASEILTDIYESYTASEAPTELYSGSATEAMADLYDSSYETTHKPSKTEHGRLDRLGDYYEKAAEKALKAGKLEQAVEFYKRAADIWRKLKFLARSKRNEEKAAEVYERMGEKAEKNNELQKAGNYYERAADLWRKTDVINRGERATTCYTRAATIYQRLQNTKGVKKVEAKTAEVLEETGGLSQKIGELQRASEFYDQAVDLYKKTGHLTKAAEVYKKTIDLWEHNNGEKARGYTQKTAALYEEAGLKAYRALEIEDAGNHYKKAANLWQKTGDTLRARTNLERAARAYEEGGRLALSLGALEKAGNYYERAADLWWKTGNESQAKAAEKKVINVYSESITK